MRVDLAACVILTAHFSEKQYDSGRIPAAGCTKTQISRPKRPAYLRNTILYIQIRRNLYYTNFGCIISCLLLTSNYIIL